MKIFLDTANINEIRKGYELGVVDGITTNPTLMAKESSKTRDEIIKEIISIVDGPISVEVISQNAHEMVKEGKELHSIAPNNIVIKVPICSEGLKAIKMFDKENIMTNCTLIFSLNQAILAIKAGATYVSPFVGRIDDIGEVRRQVVDDIVSFIDDYGYNTQVIAASIRHPLHVSEAALTPALLASSVTEPSSRSGSTLVTWMVAGLAGGKRQVSKVMVIPAVAVSRQTRRLPEPE